MDRNHHHVCTCRLYVPNRRSNRGNYVTDVDAATDVLRVPDHHAGRSGTDDPDLHAATLDNRPWPECVPAVGPVGVGRQEGKPRFSDCALEVWNAVVVFVVPY